MHLNKTALSTVQRPHHQDCGVQSLQLFLHDPVTFVKLGIMRQLNWEFSYIMRMYEWLNYMVDMYAWMHMNASACFCKIVMHF